MTPMEPKAKRLFDTIFLWINIGEWHIGGGKPAEIAIEDFIDSEIRRNVREFAEKTQIAYKILGQDASSFNKWIDATVEELSRLGIAEK